MYKAELNVKFITPAFIRGADQRNAELRTASIKGAMRWWFRALAGNYFGNDIERLRRAESYVFGSTGQRSRVDINIGSIHIEHKRVPIPMVWNRNIHIRRERDAIKEGSTFKLKIMSHDLTTLRLSISSVVAMSLLGGIGFRSNRGAGSVALPWKIKSKEEFKDLIENTLVYFISNIGTFQRKTNVRNPWNCRSIRCPPYSSFRCLSVWLWRPGEDIYEEVYYSTKDRREKSISLLGAFEKEFKNSSDHHRSNRYNYKHAVFGLPKPGKQSRRASPMKVGIVYIGKVPYVRISVFKTCPFSPNRPEIEWNFIDSFLAKIRAENIISWESGIYD